ncbi:type VI secretion system baseplate subunit TssK [Paludibaculum fermentans]|uniref:type VI secretion system baseplate subunit TssK n=1 Tax=Paludibaculum fermentans TaxID=1473598 RepID=UPI003EBF713E
MRFLSRVVWSEGMYLGPHHFQVQGRYFEDSLHFAASALMGQPYGLMGCLLDPDALSNGTLSVIHARGIFRDGLQFHMPECDAAPAPRAIGDLFPPIRSSVVVLLAVPERLENGPNCSMNEAASQTRFVARTRPYTDETTGRDERTIEVGGKDFRLLLDTEPQDGLVCLPLARVMRDGAGQYVFDPTFVPPCLQIGASEHIMLLLRRLIEILGEKSSTLSRAPAGGGDRSSREIANFWLLHAVNSALAALRHQWTSKRGHPEEIFLELSRLAGALCTFSLDSHPRNLPAFDHDNPGPCFDALDYHIRTHLEITVPTRCIEIPLVQTASCFYEGEITDTRCLDRSSWVIALHATTGDADLIEKAPRLVKVCSAKFIGELVKRAMAGLPMAHLPMPPSSVPMRVESQYFSVSKSGPFWDNIMVTRRVGIYVPAELPEPDLKLFVVLDA